MNDENASPKSIIKSTPPTDRKVQNPFDKALIGRLHKPICSPSMCKIYKQQSNGLFRWDIDQACTLIPKDIVPCNSQFEPSPDPALEKIAEEATEKFFSQELVMPSPIESSKKVKPLQISYDATTSVQITNYVQEESIIKRDVSAQTVLTLPPQLPPELEKILETFCTFTQDQNMSGEYEITANGSLRRKLLFEEHSYMEHYDSEQTDDEAQVDKTSPPSFEAHTPVVFSPHLTNDVVSKGMKRTFGTPVSKERAACGKSGYRNKILDLVDFGEPCSPINFSSPASISPVNKVTSSDEDKNIFASPESEAMATCLDCSASNHHNQSNNKALCFCTTPEKYFLKRSKSLKESPPKNRKGSFSEKRSLSMTSLHRSRSVQKLDFSMDMSLDASMHSRCSQDEPEISPLQNDEAAWSIVEESKSVQILKVGHQKSVHQEIQSSTKLLSKNTDFIDDTPIKGKRKSNILSHEISKIRTSNVSTHHMSLDCSLDSENLLHLENQKVDLTTVDLKFLTDNVSNFEYTANGTKAVSDSSTSFKRIDSGFNENTFYANASSYYECAIKPSELTVTDTSNAVSKAALKEISNVNWMRVDSGFRDETSADNVQFYASESSIKNATGFGFTEAKLEDKENDFDGFFLQSSNKNETMSMSNIFPDEVTFNCNFSSTPSKNKARKFD